MERLFQKELKCWAYSISTVNESKRDYINILIWYTYTIILSKTITDNGNGTYTLSNPEVLKRIDWPNDYSKYKGYYFCRDLTSTTCENKNLITTVNYTTFEYDNKYN